MLDSMMAKEIAEDLLHRTGVALSRDDADAFVSCFSFPQMLETTSGARLIHSPAEMKKLFAEVRKYHRETGATNLVRAIVAAEFFEENVIHSTHVSHHLKSCGTPSGKPYPALSVLRHRNGEWKIESCIYAVLDEPSLNETLTHHGQVFSQN